MLTDLDYVANMLVRAEIPQVCEAFQDRNEIRIPNANGVAFVFNNAGALTDIRHEEVD